MSKSIAKNAVFNMGYHAVSVIFPLVHPHMWQEL